MDHRQRIESLVLQAGTLALETKKELQVELKADSTEVTNVDKAVDALLRERLAALYPDAGIVSEEYARTSGITRPSCWILDPVDGTSYLVKGHDDWRIMGAYVEGGEVRFSFLHFPMRSATLWASQEGAYEVRSGVERRLAVSPRGSVDRVCHHRRSPRKMGELRFGDAYQRMVEIIDGSLDAYLAGSYAYWDIAPLQLVLEAAGGALRCQNGLPATYADPSLTLPPFVMGTKAAVDRLFRD